jgi:type III pantothenate kinase
MRLLAIDAGNTRLKWAVLNGSLIIAQGAVLTASATEQSVAAMARAMVLTRAWESHDVTHCIVSNVAGAVVQAAIEAALSSRAIKPILVEASTAACGITNGYSIPQQLGTDRFVALIAAHHTTIDPLAHKLVVMAGTALTIDALTVQGAFLGGVIVPGPSLMRHSLHHGTAQLPSESGGHAIFPRSTLDAITTGAIEAAVGTIVRLRSQFAARMKVDVDEIAVVASGGAIVTLREHLPFKATINDNLVIDGLAMLWHEIYLRNELT